MHTIDNLFQILHIDLSAYRGKGMTTCSPIDGICLAELISHTEKEVDQQITQAHQAFLQWKTTPAPHRGELIRLFSETLRKHKHTLAQLITIECGKILQESLGEVQEMIDISDFAVGLSRQLYGLTMTSERLHHRMMEQWHPLGVVGIISAFNFPTAVWAWNACLALVCGNSLVWKPSEKTPLCAIAVHELLQQTLLSWPFEIPKHISTLVLGGKDVGKQLSTHPRISLISATGSTAMGRDVALCAAQRFARTILELGGNNAMIVAPSANIELVLRSIVFSAVGTAGQRCTSLRRLFVHESLYEQLVTRLKNIYTTLPIGNPFEANTLVGPLIDSQAFDHMQQALQIAHKEGAEVWGGERILLKDAVHGYYVRPALVTMSQQTTIMYQETFAPILYVIPYTRLEDAITWNNAVPQGLSSSIFTENLLEAEQFLSACGSDCGIANVNIGPSGAEIGGAFGGEKETGGGRESGSDAWKSYMRRTTNTINYGHTLPLAQGIQFDC